MELTVWVLPVTSLSRFTNPQEVDLTASRTAWALSLKKSLAYGHGVPLRTL